MDSKENRGANLSRLLFIILMLGCFIYGHFLTKKEEAELKSFGVIAVAITNDKIDRVYRQSSTLRYYYTYEGRYYNDNFTIGDLNHESFLNKKILILVSKRDPELTLPLISPERFSKYGYTMPDSLKWMLKKE